MENCIQTSSKNRFDTEYFTGKRESSYIYDHIQVNVQKLISHHKHENYIAAMKTVLMGIIAMKIQYFHGPTGILTEPLTHIFHIVILS